MSQDSSDEDNKKVLKLLKEIKGRKIKKDKSEIRDLRKKMIDKESYINRLHKRISDDQMTKYQTDKRNAQANEMNEKLKNHILEEKLKLDEENAQLRMQIDRIKSEFVPGAKNPNIAPGQLASLNITSNQPNLGISPAEPVLVGYGTATNFSASVGGLSAAPGSLSTGICGVGSTAPPGMSLSSGMGVGM